MSHLHKKKCIPCQGGIPALKGDELVEFMSQIDGWELVGEHHIEKSFSFPNFKEALDFTNRVGIIAEEENHHPDIYLAWGKVKVSLWTHKIDGLAESDFILAAKIDQI